MERKCGEAKRAEWKRRVEWYKGRTSRRERERREAMSRKVGRQTGDLEELVAVVMVKRIKRHEVVEGT